MSVKTIRAVAKMYGKRGCVLLSLMKSIRECRGPPRSPKIAPERLLCEPRPEMVGSSTPFKPPETLQNSFFMPGRLTPPLEPAWLHLGY